MVSLWKRWCSILCLVVLGWIGIVCHRGGVLRAVSPERTPIASSILSAEALATRIDVLIEAQQKKERVQPAPLCDDSEFIRRVYLDLAGCIPSVVDVRDFLDEPRADKRRFWIDDLLQGHKPVGKPEAYARHFANVWRAWMLARLKENQISSQKRTLEAWLYQRLHENAPYDQMVRELLGGKRLVKVSSENSGRQGVAANAFLLANENKPAELAMSTSRMFLGIQMECARCHEDRSGGSWTQPQFWAFAACFVESTNTLPKITIEGTNQIVSACFPDGSTPGTLARMTYRQRLAQWLTSPTNLYFARATANRLWSYFFAIGLVDPVDAAGDHNPPSHPELLELLTQQFVLHDFDLQYMIRAITNSHTYQRSSRVAPGERVHPRLFSRMPVRSLSVEQLFDSLAEATELFDSAKGLADAPGEIRDQFLEVFRSSAPRSQPETSITQALYLMNSDFISDRTSLGSNRTLASIANMTRGGTARQVESLYIVVLSRKPRAEELQRFVTYIDRAFQPDEKRQALADVFWVLLNSGEFYHNR